MTEYIYLISAICFIYTLKGLSSHKESSLGNYIGMAGMALAIFASISSPSFHNKWLIISTIAVGGGLGVYIALNIKMTSMPQLVAGFHSLVGLAAVFIVYAAYLMPESLGIISMGSIKTSSLIEMSIGASIGAITFTGSIIAFAKLQGLMSPKSIKFASQVYISIGVVISIFSLMILFIFKQDFLILNMIIFLSLILGVLLIIPVGGADMPVIVSMLNSYSGWAAAGIGFTLNSNLLIITGAIVGASGAILSYIMCAAMNRSLTTVIFGAFYSKPESNNNEAEEERSYNPSSPEDAAFNLSNSSSVIIVPGYGMAVAQAQHAVKDLIDNLISKGVNVKFAIHPVAGRMPGHMNVLLAEANIPYEIVFELDEINNEFSTCDAAIVIGANDVTNPAAKTDKDSPIYGMPILEVENSKNIYFIKRSMAAGYAGVNNSLFFNDNTFMLFGDAKKVVEQIVKSLKE